ncbi:MAG: I78 family peptidase inhibitor [Hyphomonadaceae bacterium]|nr:I78 family peptidase inhibitor [Hyphomonadaceae bacterium]
MKNTFVALVAGIALMACSPSTEPTPVAPVEPAIAAPSMPDQTPPTTPPATDPALADTCNMAQYASLIGKPATDAGVPPASASVRIIKPGDQVTMDFSPTRLNVDLDTAGVIIALRCG